MREYVVRHICVVNIIAIPASLDEARENWKAFKTTNSKMKNLVQLSQKKYSLNPDFSLYGRNNWCTRTDTVFYPLSEVSTRTVTLVKTEKNWNWWIANERFYLLTIQVGIPADLLSMLDSCHHYYLRGFH